MGSVSRGRAAGVRYGWPHLLFCSAASFSHVCACRAVSRLLSASDAAEALDVEVAEAAGTAERLCSTNEAPPTAMQATTVTVSTRRTAGRRWRR